MARDHIKLIIEKGLKIPAHKAINSLPSSKNTKKEVKVDRHALFEQPKERKQVIGSKTLRGTRL